jgi:hypothetical protein
VPKEENQQQQKEELIPTKEKESTHGWKEKDWAFQQCRNEAWWLEGWFLLLLLVLDDDDLQTMNCLL